MIDLKIFAHFIPFMYHRVIFIFLLQDLDFLYKKRQRKIVLLNEKYFEMSVPSKFVMPAINGTGPPIIHLYEFLDVPIYLYNTKRFSLLTLDEFREGRKNTILSSLPNPKLPLIFSTMCSDQKILLYAAFLYPEDPYRFFTDVLSCYGPNTMYLSKERRMDSYKALGFFPFPHLVDQWLYYNRIQLNMYASSGNSSKWHTEKDKVDIFKAFGYLQQTLHVVSSSLIVDTYSNAWYRRVTNWLDNSILRYSTFTHLFGHSKRICFSDLLNFDKSTVLSSLQTNEESISLGSDDTLLGFDDIACTPVPAYSSDLSENDAECTTDDPSSTVNLLPKNLKNSLSRETCSCDVCASEEESDSGTGADGLPITNDAVWFIKMGCSELLSYTFIAKCARLTAGAANPKDILTWAASKHPEKDKELVKKTYWMEKWNYWKKFHNYIRKYTSEYEEE